MIIKRVNRVSREPISRDESRSMLKHHKEVIQKITEYSPQLFEKELKKAKNWLLVEELKELIGWVVHTFSTKIADLERKIKVWFAELYTEELLMANA